jgi:nucleoside-diphosphate-sugar epimerase
MIERRQTILITGLASSIGESLLQQLPEFDVAGTTLRPPEGDGSIRMHCVDLEREASCLRLVEVLRQTGASTVVHLESVTDPAVCLKERERSWQINVAGTARVLEAVAQVNRSGGAIRQFVTTSKAAVYGPRKNHPATEEARLMADSYAYAVQSREADEVVQYWAPALGDCSTWILRAATGAGSNSHDFPLSILQGAGKAPDTETSGRRLPVILPFGREHLDVRFQFVHVDDLARLIARILRQNQHKSGVNILNVAGRGSALTLEECLEVAGQKVRHLPGKWACRAALRNRYRRGASSLPVEASPYLFESTLMDTTRLRAFLGSDYDQVIRYTIEDALKDSFRHTAAEEADQALAGA